jgi:hypothetical protein
MITNLDFPHLATRNPRNPQLLFCLNLDSHDFRIIRIIKFGGQPTQPASRNPLLLLSEP